MDLPAQSLVPCGSSSSWEDVESSTEDDIWSKTWSPSVMEKETRAMAPKKTFFKDYDIDGVIGKGSYGSVFLVSKKSNEDEKYAVKMFSAVDRPNPNLYWTNALREIRVIKESLCPNIISYHGCCFDANMRHMFLFMEFGSGGTLKNIILHRDLRCQLKLPLLGHVIRSLANGLVFLHARRLVHRDVKADNVLLTRPGQVKLGDFGLCCRLDSPDLLLCAGSPVIMSPEMIRVPGKPRVVDTKTDVWSLGIIIRQMLSGCHIYPSVKTIKELLPIILAEPRTFPEVQSKSLKTLLVACLQLRAAERATAEEVLRSDFLKTAASAEDFRPLVHQAVARSESRSRSDESLHRQYLHDKACCRAKAMKEADADTSLPGSPSALEPEPDNRLNAERETAVVESLGSENGNHQTSSSERLTDEESEEQSEKEGTDAQYVKPVFFLGSACLKTPKVAVAPAPVMAPSPVFSVWLQPFVKLLCLFCATSLQVILRRSLFHFQKGNQVGDLVRRLHLRAP